jgi:hypothetical protein
MACLEICEREKECGIFCGEIDESASKGKVSSGNVEIVDVSKRNIYGHGAHLSLTTTATAFNSVLNCWLSDINFPYLSSRVDAVLIHVSPSTRVIVNDISGLIGSKAT